jgi:hypothetical protein
MREERSPWFGILLGLVMLSVWFGWVVMLVVGNLYHDGCVTKPLGFWEAQHYGMLLALLIGLPYAALIVATVADGHATRGPDSY